MRRAILLLFLLAVAALALPPSALAAKRVALVIGISDYQTLAKLNNPVPDAKAIAAALKSHGFEVAEYYDLPRAELLDALEEFSSVADQASVALVYYAGHGMEMAGKNVLAPTDMEIDCEKKTPKRALDLDQLFSAVAGAPQQIVLLDACRNDPFPQCPKRSIGGGSGFRGFTRVGAEDRSLLIANSTLGGQLADDGAPGQHSPFTAALLAQFATGAGSYLRDLLEAAAGDVQRKSHGGQVPEILTRGGAVRICLDEANCGGIAATPQTPPVAHPPGADAALDAWNAAKDTVSVEVLEHFIAKFSDSFYASLAKAKLVTLKNKEEPKVAVVTPPEARVTSPKPAVPKAADGLGVNPASLENIVFLDLKDGRVTILLRPDLAPKHVERVKKLVREGFYDGIVFHRVIDGFIAQTGDPTGNGASGSKYPDLQAEFTTEVKFDRGTVGAARTADPHSANSQFFIDFAPAPSLDGQYTIWGEVIDGMDAIDALKRGEPPSTPEKIVKMQVAADADRASKEAATALLSARQ